MKHLIAGLLLLSVVIAAVMMLGQCSAPAPDAPGIELDIDRAKPRKTLKPQAPKPAAPKAQTPKGTKR